MQSEITRTEFNATSAQQNGVQQRIQEFLQHLISLEITLDMQRVLRLIKRLIDSLSVAHVDQRQNLESFDHLLRDQSADVVEWVCTIKFNSFLLGVEKWVSQFMRKLRADMIPEKYESVLDWFSVLANGSSEQLGANGRSDQLLDRVVMSFITWLSSSQRDLTSFTNHLREKSKNRKRSRSPSSSRPSSPQPKRSR